MKHVAATQRVVTREPEALSTADEAAIGSDKRGTIEMLHEAWQAALDVANINDELDLRLGANREPWARCAVRNAGLAESHIGQAILLSPIRTEADASILMLHLDLAIEALNHSKVKEDDPLLEQVLCASNSLFDWRLRTAPNPASFQSRNTMHHAEMTRARAAHLRGEGPGSSN